MADLSGLFDCKICGAVVKSRAQHAAWHEELNKKLHEVEGIAEDALESAEQAQNVLYQNNIQV